MEDMNRVLTKFFLLLLPFLQIVMLSGCGAGRRSAQHQQEATDIRTVRQDSLLSAHLSRSLLSKTIDIEHIVYDTSHSASLSPPVHTVTRIAIHEEGKNDSKTVTRSASQTDSRSLSSSTLRKTSSGSFFYGRWIIIGLMFVFLWVWIRKRGKGKI